LLEADPGFDLIETMRFDPHDGIVNLDRHLARLKSTAADLGFNFDRHEARNELQAATFGHRAKALLRLLVSWRGAMAIQLCAFDNDHDEPVAVSIEKQPVGGDDWRLRHKTTDRRFYDEARRRNGTFETIFEDDEGRLTEGSRSSLFVKRGDKLLTPPLRLGLIPGVLRARLIDEGEAEEAELRREDLADGFFIGNSARGLIAARLA
jgi:para-aminobenzoate synthetase/4-amino-4-deoxychorismate lyase